MSRDRNCPPGAFVIHGIPPQWTTANAWRIDQAALESSPRFGPGGSPVHASAARQDPPDRGALLLVSATASLQWGLQDQLQAQLAELLQDISGRRQPPGRWRRALARFLGRPAAPPSLTFAVGRFFRGYYPSQGRRIYDQVSIAVHLIGLSQGEMLELARRLCYTLYLPELVLDDREAGTRFWIGTPYPGVSSPK